MEASIMFKIAVIEDYIFHRKNVRVSIRPRLGEIRLLDKGYEIAMKWFRENNLNKDLEF